MPVVLSYSEARTQVEQSVERFDRNRDIYARPNYKETQVRVEFIDPLFEALGSFTQFSEQLSIRTIHFDDDAGVARYDKMVALVECMLDLHKKLEATTIPADKTLYRRQIEATVRQIDVLVYELYGVDGGGDRDCEGGVRVWTTKVAKRAKNAKGECPRR
jgi:hypothetical protein